MPKRPSVSFIFAADDHNEGERGKIDAQGIFNELGVWGIPASREFSVVVGLSDVTTGTHSFALRLEPPRGEAEVVAEGELTAQDNVPGTVIAYKVSVQLTELGSYKVALRYRDGQRNSAYVRLMITRRPWPQLPKGKELERLLKEPDVIKHARAVLSCKGCSQKYIFQANLDPEEPLPEDARAFPDAGEFRCPECDEVHYTKDIEGQVLSQLARTAD